MTAPPAKADAEFLSVSLTISGFALCASKVTDEISCLIALAAKLEPWPGIAPLSSDL